MASDSSPAWGATIWSSPCCELNAQTVSQQHSLAKFLQGSSDRKRSRPMFLRFHGPMIPPTMPFMVAMSSVDRQGITLPEVKSADRHKSLATPAAAPGVKARGTCRQATLSRPELFHAITLVCLTVPTPSPLTMHLTKGMLA